MKDNTIKEELQNKGWSYRRAAKILGITYQYLSDVSNGKYQSHRLSIKVNRLPTYSDFVAKFPTYFENKRRRPRKISNN